MIKLDQQTHILAAASIASAIIQKETHKGISVPNVADAFSTALEAVAAGADKYSANKK